jgi:hypothetical protein
MRLSSGRLPRIAEQRAAKRNDITLCGDLRWDIPASGDPPGGKIFGIGL